METTACYFYLPKDILNMHVHGRDMNQKHKTTLLDTINRALSSFINVIGFMPNTDPPIITAAVLEAYYALAMEAKQMFDSACQVYIWFGVTDSNLTECRHALQRDYVPGLKIYPKSPEGKVITTSSGGIGVMSDETLLAAMRLVRQFDKILAIHPFDEDEYGYIRKVLDLARQVPCVKIMFCHIAGQANAELIRNACDSGMNIMIEVCPQYLIFDNQGTNWRPGLHPNFYKCLNALRGSRDRNYLYWLIDHCCDAVIIGSDHAPHTINEKLKGASGFVSLQETVATIVTIAIERRMGYQRVAKLLSLNARRFFNIPASEEVVKYKFEKKPDDISYGSHIVNPWKGVELYFPVKPT